MAEEKKDKEMTEEEIKEARKKRKEEAHNNTDYPTNTVRP
jgi:hypothetical protein